jgi:hypothetical protein
MSLVTKALTACIGEMRNAYKIYVGKPKRKRPLGRNRRRWEDNSELDLRRRRCEGSAWNELARDRDKWLAFVNKIKAGIFLTD